VKLRRLSDEEYDEAVELARNSATPLDQCPTCQSRPTEIEPGIQDRQQGRYTYKGKTYSCDCDQQIALRRHYLLAHIPDWYMRLDWTDYDGAAQDTVSEYLHKWQTAKHMGMNLKLYGPIGVGKTFAATYIAKELVKRGERAYFIPFEEVVSLYQRSHYEAVDQQLKRAVVLVLDELSKPTSLAQQEFFAMKFEELIRHRTNYNLPTIITTNLNDDELHHHYPRPYSLLAHKVIDAPIEGDDARMDKSYRWNRELWEQDEVRPIT
jgi:DNA replication protein DnaC